MYLLYLDDSGSWEDPHQKCFVLGGVAVYERQTHFISEKMNELAAELFSDSECAIASVEFHAAEAFSAKQKPWTKFKDQPPDKRRKPLDKVLQILADSHESTIAFACVVSSSKNKSDTDPLKVAFEELCRRFDLFLKRKYDEDNKNAQRGLIIMDQSKHERVLQSLATEFKSSGTKWGTLKNFAEVPLFADSRASRLLQLADNVAYAVFRRYENGDASYMDIFDHRFDAVDNRIHGLVHWSSDGHPPQDKGCRCPACMSRLLDK